MSLPTLERSPGKLREAGLVVAMEWVGMMDWEKLMVTRFKYVYKMGAQGILGALTSLLGRLTRDWTKATHRT